MGTMRYSIGRCKVDKFELSAGLLLLRANGTLAQVRAGRIFHTGISVIAKITLPKSSLAQQLSPEAFFLRVFSAEVFP
jgi:hypothetical protein